jgi:hypothetical protein
MRAEIIRRALRISAVRPGSFMTSSAVALGSFNLAGLRMLCAIGSCAGFSVVMFGLRLDRKAQAESSECGEQSADTGSISEEPRAECCEPSQIIRLSTDPAPTKSSEMSQQEKIAAALSRAESANAPWSSPTASSTATAVTTPGKSPAIPHHIPDHGRTQPPSSSTRRLFLLGGCLLVLLSLSVLLALR